MDSISPFDREVKKVHPVDVYSFVRLMIFYDIVDFIGEL
jgi:hypothetical protein